MKSAKDAEEAGNIAEGLAREAGVDVDGDLLKQLIARAAENPATGAASELADADLEAATGGAGMAGLFGAGYGETPAQTEARINAAYDSVMAYRQQKEGTGVTIKPKD